MSVTSGVPESDGYNVQPAAHSVPLSAQPFKRRTWLIVACCKANGGDSVLLAGDVKCRQRLRQFNATFRRDEGATAANKSGCAAHNRYVKIAPLE